MIHVAIILVNWNGKTDTIECLDSVMKLSLQDINVSTIVVDNGSSDDSVSGIERKFPQVIIQKSPENLGFTGGNNIGIKHAMEHGADFIWLLNNDTVVDRLSLQKLLDAAGETHGAMFGSKIYFYPGKEFHFDRYKESQRGHVLWYAGGVVDWNNMYASHRGVDEVDLGQYDKIEKTQFITGCSMLIRRDVIESIGSLDEKFYAYFEDLDYCLKAGKKGFRCWYVPQSIVWHKNAGSTSRPGNPTQDYYFTRNRLLIGMRYAPLRTKAALVKEAGKMVLTGSSIRRQAVIDACLGRYGKHN